MQCFVISPIGTPDSATRAHADDVFECIIAPACKEAGVQVHRADQKRDIGRVSQQMFDAILNSNFCIAVLHEFTPNVFYEIAVAHSAGIPVIVMAEKGLDPPFDIKDERVTHYDLSPRAIYNKVNIQALQDMIASVQQLKGVRRVPFGENLTPLDADPEQSPVSVRDETTNSGEYWKSLVDDASERLYVAGIMFTGWKGIQGMSHSLRAAVARGCELRIMTMDVDNDCLRGLINPDVATENITDLRAPTVQAREWFRRAIGKDHDASVRPLRSGGLHQQIIISDNRALVSPYLYSAGTAHSPCLEIQASSPIFKTFLNEFEDHWGRNAPVDKQDEEEAALPDGAARAS